jgi:hypothetical protein
MAKDDADIASEQEEYQRLEALYRVARYKPQPTGTCINCGLPVEGQAFCDVYCREDHERRVKHSQRTKAHHD